MFQYGIHLVESLFQKDSLLFLKVSSVAYSFSGSYLASGSLDGTAGTS